MARDDDCNYYIEHVERGQWEPDERDRRILATARRDRLRYPHNEPIIYAEQEPGSSGIDSFKYLARKLAGFPVYADRVTGAKEVRAEPFASQCAALNVIPVEDGLWDINAWIDELCAFPNGTYCDQVDSASGAFAKLAKVQHFFPFRVIRIGDRSTGRPSPVRIVVCSRAELAIMTPIDDRSLLLCITDPPACRK
jgi:predicted phage terminase large subunit-like protein